MYLFGGTYTKIGTIQRRLAWPLRKDDTQNREAFHIFRILSSSLQHAPPRLTSIIHSSIHSSIHPSIHPSVRPSVRPSIHPSIQPTVLSSVDPSVHLFLSPALPLHNSKQPPPVTHHNLLWSFGGSPHSSAFRHFLATLQVLIFWSLFLTSPHPCDQKPSPFLG